MAISLFDASAPLDRAQIEAQVEDPVLTLPLDKVRLRGFAHGERFHRLDRLESYYRRRQDAHKAYDWSGSFFGYGGESPVKPGFWVPYAHRQPAARYDIARLAVDRFSALLFGADRFPKITVAGDEAAQRYVLQLVKATSLVSRLYAARQLGGAVGSVGMSYGFRDGKPRVEVHNAKHLMPLRWADRAECKLGAVLKCYSYPRDVYDAKERRIVTTTLYYVRYWDENVEIVWEPMTASQAEDPNWRRFKHDHVEHGMGVCPVVWIQNRPDAEDPDGEGDYEGTEPNMDELNQLLSGASSGVKANNDPTLVVKMSPKMNDGSLRKGSGNAIFSEGGAEYLEISGASAAATLDTVEKLRAMTLDMLSVVVADPERLAGAAQSAAALRILYAPMLAATDVLRGTYGEKIVELLKGLLRGARNLLGQSRIETNEETGEMTEVRLAVELPPYFEKNEDGTQTEVALDPGSSEHIELNWNPYFAPTWEDISKASASAMAASGGKAVISHRTAVQSVQELFGVVDVDQELEEIAADQQRAIEQMRESFAVEGGGGPVPPGTERKPPGDEDEDEDEDAGADEG